MRYFFAQNKGLRKTVCARLYVASGRLQVGNPGGNGLSVEQRKRLTIGVELVANPSVVFMDEPTSGKASMHASHRYEQVARPTCCAFSRNGCILGKLMWL